VMMIPFFISGAGWKEYQHLSSSALTAIIFLGVGCSGLGYLFWYAALERLEASQVAAFLYIEPMITLLAAVALLGEPVAPTTIVGGIMVLLGVLTVQKSNPRESEVL
jgi:drug/metabolite transporter (DMT)-like permease